MQRKSKTTVNKLVRDLVPALVEKDKFNFITLSDDDYKKELINKLKEEITELTQALKNDDISAKLEEMADVLEVMSCIAKAHEIDNSLLFAKAEEKRKNNGSFLAKIKMTTKATK